MNIDLNLDVLAVAYDDVDVTMDILCPDGLVYSEWFSHLELTDNDLYNDYLESLKNRNAYMTEQKGDEYKPLIPMTFEAFLISSEYEKEDPDYLVAFVELYSNCVWDIFSGNNKVIQKGHKVDLGTWRASAQFIADFVNHYCHVDKVFNSSDFYCGNIDDSFREAYLPIYELIFQRLKIAECDWVIDEEITMSMDAEFGEEMEQTEVMKVKESTLLAALAENMNKEQLKRVEKELQAEEQKNTQKDLPAVVLAYVNIYGTMPLILKK